MGFLRRKLREWLAEDDGYYPASLGRLVEGKAEFNDLPSDLEKLEAVLNSPAVLKVFSLQCDLFSLGKIKVYKGDKEQLADPALDRFAKPNPFQTRSQFLWSSMFWDMIGNLYITMNSKVVTNSDTRIYTLEHRKMEFPQSMIDNSDKLIYSNSSLKTYLDQTIIYRYDDGTSTTIKLSDIICISDLTNGLGNWFKGPSRLDALYKVVANSEKVLDAENINYKFSEKFLVAGQQNKQDVSKLPMSPDEKKDIESKLMGQRPVHAIKSMIEIQRFVSDLKALDLPQQYLAQFFLIGAMYNIPRDVLELYASSKYENQEKARAGHVSYTLEPKGADMMEKFAQVWGYPALGKKIVIDWSHLSFMQVFEREKTETQLKKTVALTNLAKLAVPIEEANAFLGTKFTSYEQPKDAGQTENSANDSGAD